MTNDAQGTGTAERAYDVVVFGATGYTGRLIAGELAKTYGTAGLRWALGGRDRARLEAVRRELAAAGDGTAQRGELAKLPLVVADSHDAAALDELARQTRVVCSAAGPFARHGAELVAACLRQGTHYCDTTGEPTFIREMVDRHHEAAREAGLRLVHCCGIDSVPSDLGCLMLYDHLQEHRERALAEIRCLVTVLRGGFSGGTLASILELWEQARQDKAVRRVLVDPYALNDEGHRRGPDRPERPRPELDAELHHWTGPFLMAPINSAIVRRTNQQLDYAYGEQFRYSERRGYGPGPKGWWRAHKEAAGTVAFFTAGMAAPGRWALRRLLPSPGQGPTPAQRAAGAFRFELLAVSDSGPGEPPQKLRGVVAAERDGYDATAIMASEAAVCLARDAEQLPDRYGVLTPASAMGMLLVQRLRQAGLTFTVHELA